MKTTAYGLSTEFHVKYCQQMAENGNMARLRSALRYALYDLGLSQD